MKMKEESSFLQGVESRLDSLFAEDTQPIKEKDSDPPQATVQKVASDIKEDIKEVTDIKETRIASEVSSEPVQPQDKSTFISEIEKRFSAIFGEDDKDMGGVTDAQASEDLKKIIAEAEQTESIKSDLPPENLSSPPSSILDSPLKEMKSIILSIEWEINDHILEQLEDEINKLYLAYTGNRIIQGFLRILRFMGRYVRVRGVRSNQDSINLLLAVYDHLENVMVSEGMTDAKKHIILIDNIKKYRAWVESTDLETPEVVTEKVESSDVESLIDKSIEEQKTEIEPIKDLPFSEEEPIAKTFIDETAHETTPLTLPLMEPDALVQTQPPLSTEIPPSSQGAELEDRVITAMKNLPPNEAFIYAFGEIKKTFQAEVDALKEEIRILKSAR